jgi:hypothetical protein
MFKKTKWTGIPLCMLSFLQKFLAETKEKGYF